MTHDLRDALNRVHEQGDTPQGIAIDKPTIARLAYDGLIASKHRIELTELGERLRNTLNGRAKTHNERKAAKTE